MITGTIIAIISILIDQLTKFLIYGKPAVSIMGDFLWFSSVLNKGVAFGMFQNATIFFIIFSSIATIVFIYLLYSKKYCRSRLEKGLIGLILAGTLSNLIDRIIFGGVRDFIYLKFINFAIFNVADMCIVVGVIIYLIVLIIKMFKEDNVNKENDKTTGELMTAEEKEIYHEEEIRNKTEIKEKK